MIWGNNGEFARCHKFPCAAGEVTGDFYYRRDTREDPENAFFLFFERTGDMETRRARASPTFWERCEIEENQQRGIQSKETRARKFVLRIARFPSNLKNRGQLRAHALGRSVLAFSCVFPVSLSLSYWSISFDLPSSSTIICRWKIRFLRNPSPSDPSTR